MCPESLDHRHKFDHEDTFLLYPPQKAAVTPLQDAVNSPGPGKCLWHLKDTVLPKLELEQEQLPLSDCDMDEENGSFRKQVFQFLTQHLSRQMIADNRPAAAD